jgi:hypothetical protein
VVVAAVVAVAGHDGLAGGGEKGSRPPRERKGHGDTLLPGCLLWVTSVGRVPALSRWCADVTCATHVRGGVRGKPPGRCRRTETTVLWQNGCCAVLHQHYRMEPIAHGVLTDVTNDYMPILGVYSVLCSIRRGSDTQHMHTYIKLYHAVH